MFLIPGFLISLLTFPGIIAQEIAIKLFCDLCGIEVYDVCYFKVSSPSGYVAHGPVPDLKSRFMVTLGPMILCSVLCSILCVPFTSGYRVGLDSSAVSWLSIFLLWVGISTGMHAFPSHEGLNSLVDHMKKEKQGFNLLYLLALPWVLLMRIGIFLKVLWFDAIYAIILAAVPSFFIGLLH